MLHPVESLERNGTAQAFVKTFEAVISRRCRRSLPPRCYRPLEDYNNRAPCTRIPVQLPLTSRGHLLAGNSDREMTRKGPERRIRDSRSATTHRTDPCAGIALAAIANFGLFYRQNGQVGDVGLYH